MKPRELCKLCEKKVKNNDNNPVLGTRGSEFNPWDLQNEVFGGAHHYLRTKSDSNNAVASCTMGLLAATETWFFARVFLEWKSSFENGNIDACCHHSLPQTISHSSPFPEVQSGFYLNKPCTTEGLSGDFVLLRQLKLCPETSQTNAPKTIFQAFTGSLLWSWLNLRDYSGDFCTAKKQSHWEWFLCSSFPWIHS